MNTITSSIGCPTQSSQCTPHSTEQSAPSTQHRAVSALHTAQSSQCPPHSTDHSPLTQVGHYLRRHQLLKGPVATASACDNGTLHTKTDRQTDTCDNGWHISTHSLLPHAAHCIDGQTDRQTHSHSPRVDRKLLNISASSNSAKSPPIPSSDTFEEMDLERLLGELASLK